MSQQIPVIVGDSGEDYGLMAPHRTLEAAAHDVDTVCPDTEAGKTIETAIHDFRRHRTYLGGARPQPRGHHHPRRGRPRRLRRARRPGERAPECLRTYDIVPEWLATFIHLLDAGSETREPAADD